MAAIKLAVPQFGDRILVVGIERKKGEYEGKEYDNTYLHGLAWKANEDSVAFMVNDTWKIKTEKMHPVNVGEIIEATYDRTGKIVSFDTVEQRYEGIEVHEA